jgi:hypothetical protein
MQLFRGMTHRPCLYGFTFVASRDPKGLVHQMVRGFLLISQTFHRIEVGGSGGWDGSKNHAHHGGHNDGNNC